MKGKGIEKTWMRFDLAVLKVEEGEWYKKKYMLF